MNRGLVVILFAIFGGVVFGWTASESGHRNCPSDAAADTVSHLDDNEDRFIFTNFVQLEDPEYPKTSGVIRMVYDQVDKTCMYYYLKGAYTSFGLGQASCPKSYQQPSNNAAPVASDS